MKTQFQLFKAVFYLMLLAGFIGHAYADNVPVDSVRVVATNAFSYFSGKSPSETVIRNITPIAKNDTVIIYICNFEKGFIIVSADNAAYPVLGFSDEGNFSINDMPPAVELITNGYKDEILHAKRTRTTASEEIRNEWWKYLRNTVDRSFYAPTHYLIQTKWAQKGGYRYPETIGYNYFCPIGEYNQRTLVGCGAVALAQVLHYWACSVYPHGTAYNRQQDTLINLSGQNYEWYSMHEQKSDLHNAKLLADCAYAINSIFGSSTTSYMDTIALTLRNNFGFANACLVYKFSDDEWITTLKNEISQRRPILYAGQNSTSNEGHGWIIDGYNQNNFFHCNFGWGDRYNPNYIDCDGWYLLSNITPSGHNYDVGHHAIINCYPTTYTNTEFIDSNIQSGTYSGHKIVIENSSVNSNANVILDPDCSTEIFGPFSVPLGSTLHVK